MLLREGVNRTQRGTGTGTVKPPKGAQVVSVKRTRASDFDPLGDDDEHHDERGLAVDKDSGTSWSTEAYRGGDARQGRRRPVRRRRPGRRRALDRGRHARARLEGGDPRRRRQGAARRTSRTGTGRAAAPSKSKKQRFKLDTGDRHRYYLVWITALPKGSERVKIAEVTLFAPRR